MSHSHDHPHDHHRHPSLPVLETRVEHEDAPLMPTRRGMLQFMGAVLAFGTGVAGCDRKPKRKIISRVKEPLQQKPGQNVYYSSTWTEFPYPYGIVVKTVDGRPIKVDGAPEHPATLGGSSVPLQAMVLGLYDPERLKAPMISGSKKSWAEADKAVVAALRSSESTVIVTRSSIGPSERALLGELLALAPKTRHLVHEAIHDGPRRAAWAKMYGADGELVPRFDRAGLILSLDSDFLGTDGPTVLNIRRFADGHKADAARAEKRTPSRLWVAESTMSVTGLSADQRLRVKPSAQGALLDALLGEASGLAAAAQKLGVAADLLRGLHGDLRAQGPRALVVAGPHLPASVHARVAQLNAKLAGETPSEAPVLEWDPAPPTLPVTPAAELESALAKADVAILLDVDPVADGLTVAPKHLIVHSLLETETSKQAEVRLPSSHNLESWNDRAWGQAGESLCQPVIAPLYESRQEADSLLAWAQALAAEGAPVKAFPDFHAYVARRWGAPPSAVGMAAGAKAEAPAGEGANGDAPAGPPPMPDHGWDDVLRLGGRFTPKVQALPALDANNAVALVAADKSGVGDGLEVVIHPHHALFDGRFDNNAWLHEIPDPVSKVAWESTLTIGVATAKKLGLAEGDLVSLEVGKRTVKLPVLVQPGTAADVLSVTLGYGRKSGPVAVEAAGANLAQVLGRDETPRIGREVKVQKVWGNRLPPRAQHTFDMHGREIALDGTWQKFSADPSSITGHRPEHELRLTPKYDYAEGPKWGMTIDLDACVGCNACVVGCQSENNIAVVGRGDVERGRDMHWLRIDRYEEAHASDPDDVSHFLQPMLCQHCDDAPCENVCPVRATSHSPEGLNEMAYNRCVGTRYCSNNCPYKVRRFNYRRYHEHRQTDPVQELLFNPQVTVRSVGVMEKCSFCVQRIQAAKFVAKNEGRPIADGEVVTACQAACPAQAISFGNVLDEESKVAHSKENPRAYHVLGELNVGPNVTYLAKIRNPLPGASRTQDKE